MLRSVFGRFRNVFKQTFAYSRRARTGTRFPKFFIKSIRPVDVAVDSAFIASGIWFMNFYKNQLEKTTLPLFQLQHLWQMDKNIADTVKRTLPAVVKIQAPGRSGSGFIVDKEGLILTNHHVVQEQKKVMVLTADQEAYHGVVLSRNAKLDLAVIKIQGATKEFPIIKFGNSDKIKTNDFVMAVGYAWGWKNCVSTGVVQGGRYVPNDTLFLPIRHAIRARVLAYPGNSGGPLINRNGEAVGVVYGGLSFITSYNMWKKNSILVTTWSVPSNAAEKFLTDAKNQEREQVRANIYYSAGWANENETGRSKSGRERA